MTRHFSSLALPKCYDRLGKAKRALQACRSANSFSQFASDWSDFLIHTGGIVHALEAGSSLTSQGKQWYGGVKRMARADPLVLYMTQARNAEEHSLEGTTKNEPSSISIGAPGEGVYVKNLTFDQAFMQNPQEQIKGRAFRHSDGKPPTITQTAGGPALLPVHERLHNMTFRPPSEHMGKPIKDTNPISIGELYVAYIESVISKASELS